MDLLRFWEILKLRVGLAKEKAHIYSLQEGKETVGAEKGKYSGHVAKKTS